MRRSFLLAALLCCLPLTASAQNKISGKINCGKPDPSHSLEVGDRPGHVLALNKALCTWTTPLEIAGTQSKDAIDFSTVDITAKSANERGYSVTTTTSGDKFTVRYQGTITMSKDGPGTMEGKWSFVNGTGKLKGIQGGGTFKGTAQADGGGIVDVEGEYTISEAKAPAKKPN